jgi:two-component system sensor histidine kinase KdpD
MDRHRRMLLGELIERNAREMTGLLNNVLEFMRLETVTGPIHAEWESLEELVATAWKRNEQQLANLRIVTRIASQLPPVYVDAQLIVQLFSNLLENASKYTPAGTCVTVAAELRSETVQVSLEDEGPGFGPRDPESLFEMFERGSERGPRGTGLGLAICRAIARLHGGEIRAMAGPRGGARFEIALPLRADAPAALEAA